MPTSFASSVRDNFNGLLIALCAFMAWFLLGSGLERQQKTQQANTQQRSNLSSALPVASQEGSADTKGQTQEQQGGFSGSGADWLMIWVTLVAVLAAFKSLALIEEQVRAARSSADVAREALLLAHRPWFLAKSCRANCEGQLVIVEVTFTNPSRDPARLNHFKVREVLMPGGRMIGGRQPETRRFPINTLLLPTEDYTLPFSLDEATPDRMEGTMLAMDADFYVVCVVLDVSYTGVSGEHVRHMGVQIEWIRGTREPRRVFLMQETQDERDWPHAVKA